ncbi:hypothetical protein BHYA_0003g00980 [Botrytis hyacinthi]|uniref:BTB domain-containing protein n=1 Tax=Botrytis hyacinthi TaxID=278943 RepID=A0A4Z1H1N6_9HELO|nr:hypothetical protein BHYA_0003g00980 [Botrytis hyacinthi]
MVNNVNQLGELILKEGDKYSDLIIRFQGKVFPVHRNIICVQSEFFTAMVDRNWKDGSTCEILLDYDEADFEIFENMVRFFYHRSLGDEHGLIALTKLYIVGEKWSIPFLKKSAALKVKKALDARSRQAFSPTEAVFKMLKLAYSSLPLWDIDLKIIILHHVLKHESLEPLMNNRDFRAFVARNESIAMDLLEAQFKLLYKKVPPTLTTQPEMTSKTSGALEDMAYKSSDKNDPPNFTIKCKGHSFLVHRDIVAPQSTPLGAAMNTGKFLEGTRREMILSDEHDDPEIVGLMVEFLYTGEYTISFPSNTSSSSRSSSDEAIRCICHVALHIFSDLWDIPSLQVLTLSNLQAALSRLPLSHFASVLQYIYEETPGSYTHVRQIAVKGLMERFTVGDIMKVKELRELLSADGEFAVDLLIWGEERRVKRERRVGRDWEQSAVRGRRVCEECMGRKGDILGEAAGWADNTGVRF